MMKVPYINLGKQNRLIKRELLRASERVFVKGNFILGEEVAALEQEMADWHGVRYGIGVNSGTDALVLALRAAGIGKGDEVITVSHSFVATAASIVLAGATPVFVDINEDQTMDPLMIPAAITKRTAAIIPVHLTGKPAEMDPIMKIARRYGLLVIEDCAQAVSAEYKGKKVGSFGDFASFSMHPLKNLSACGDAGMILTNNAKWASSLRVLRNIGLKDRDTCIQISGNSRLDELQAALLRVKLKYLEKYIALRRQNAALYSRKLRDVIRVPQDTSHGRDVYHTYVVQTDRRDACRAYLLKNDIDAKIHYPRAIHQQKPFRTFAKRADLPVTERMVKQILSLPIDQTLSGRQIAYVGDTILQFFRR